VIASTAATAATVVVTSKNIKDGTIQTVDISAKAKHALKGNRGPRGLQGPSGPAGLQGPSGPAGPAGPTGLKGDTGETGATGPEGPDGPSGISKVWLMDYTFPHVNEVPDAGGAIARINLPAGNFRVFVNASFSNAGAAEARVECRIPGGVPGPSAGNRFVTLGGTGGNPSEVYDTATIAFHVIVVPDAQQTFNFECSDNGGEVTMSSVPFSTLRAPNEKQGPGFRPRRPVRPPRLEGWGADGEAVGVGRVVGAGQAVDPEGAPTAPVSWAQADR
jgi:Collagen triple helix repeat (20 copies)